MYNMQLRKWGIVQVRKRTQIEKRVWNPSCYVVEAQIPKKVKKKYYYYYYYILITMLLSHGWVIHKTSYLQEVIKNYNLYATTTGKI